MTEEQTSPRRAPAPLRKRIGTSLWIFFGHSPALFPVYIRIKDVLTGSHMTREMLYSRKTDLVIEGYPRSGNTFAVVAFRHAQARPFSIAHHLHAASQVIHGVRDGKPVLLLVREPADAVLSFLVRNPELKPAQAIRYYIAFHRRLLPFAPGCVVARHDTVTRRYDAVLRALNARFHTDFGLFDPSPENTRACFDTIDAIRPGRYTGDEEMAGGRPSERRDRVKASAAPLLDTPRCRAALQEARELYASYRTLSDTLTEP